MNLITYALSKKGIINVDGKQYKPELENGEIVYKEIEKEKPEELIEYTTFTVGPTETGILVMINNTPNSIEELYVNDVAQQVPVLSMAEILEGGGIEGEILSLISMLTVKEGDIIKIKGGFSLALNAMLENMINISNIEIQSNLKDCSYMFAMCTSLTEAPVIPKGVTNCSAMFSTCTSLIEAPVIPNSVTNCSSMFVMCTSLTTLPSENVDLMYNHNNELEHGLCYSDCTNIIDPITYDEIPDDWKLGEW